MIDQRPVVPPPASHCNRDTEREDHPGGWSGGGRKGMSPLHSSKSVSPFETKNTCGVVHCTQYEQSSHGRDIAMEKITSGRVLHRLGAAAKTVAPGQKGKTLAAKAGDWQRKEATQKPKALATVNHKLGPVLRISQDPQDER
jgi:hypothetical protein